VDVLDLETEACAVPDERLDRFGPIPDREDDLSRSVCGEQLELVFDERLAGNGKHGLRQLARQLAESPAAPAGQDANRRHPRFGHQR
jgi:hypothetical protein